jgi:hypothetical protein
LHVHLTSVDAYPIGVNVYLTSDNVYLTSFHVYHASVNVLLTCVKVYHHHHLSYNLLPSLYINKCSLNDKPQSTSHSLLIDM